MAAEDSESDHGIWINNLLDGTTYDDDGGGPSDIDHDGVENVAESERTDGDDDDDDHDHDDHDDTEGDTTSDEVTSIGSSISRDSGIFAAFALDYHRAHKVDEGDVEVPSD
jgi:hypothetical protein